MATTTINVQLGTAFWLMLLVLVIGGVMWAKLGSEKMSKVLSSGGLRMCLADR